MRGVADRNLDTSFGYLRDGWVFPTDNRYRDSALLTTPPRHTRHYLTSYFIPFSIHNYSCIPYCILQHPDMPEMPAVKEVVEGLEFWSEDAEVLTLEVAGQPCWYRDREMESS